MTSAPSFTKFQTVISSVFAVFMKSIKNLLNTWALAGTCPLWKCYKVFCALVVTAKTLIRRVIYALFSQPVVGFWGQRRPDPQRGSIPGLRWGTFVPRPLICPPLEKILRAPMPEHWHGSLKHLENKVNSFCVVWFVGLCFETYC